MRKIRKIELLLEKIRPIDPPVRFEKRSDGFYGLKHGEWKKYTLEELTALEDTIKAQYEQSLKRFEPMDIDVRIIDDKTDPEEPENLYKWPEAGLSKRTKSATQYN